jgi:hypothetical protein
MLLPAVEIIVQEFNSRIIDKGQNPAVSIQACIFLIDEKLAPLLTQYELNHEEIFMKLINQ